VIGDCVFQAKATEPAVGKVEMYLFAQTSFGANAEAVAHNQHADHELRIDRRPTGVAVVRCEVLAKSIELELAINTAQQVRARNMVIKVEGVEEFVLTTTLLTHHDVPPLSINVFQDSQNSIWRGSFSTESAALCLTAIGGTRHPQRPVDSTRYL
jgi:hypothetical protein